MDYSNLLAKIEEAYSNKMPFVTYKKPNEKSIKGIFQHTPDLNYTEDFNEQGFVFAPFNTEEKTILFPLENSEIYTIDFPRQKSPLEEKESISQNDSDKNRYIRLVSNCIAYLKKGKTKKVVLSRREDIDLTEFELTKTFEKLVYHYSNAMVYIWYHPKVGLWFGASPEQLLQVKLNEFRTVSLAGTQVFKDTLNVHWNKKELEEQQIVTNYIESNISPIVDNVSISKPSSVKAGNLIHLKTEVKGRLNKKYSLKMLIHKLHPTPAVCGMPKLDAQEFILKNEGYKREFYTGYFGELNIDYASDLFVNLRCMKVESNKAALFIGGGITTDSIAENEWLETVEKSKVMKKVLSN